MMPKLTFYPLGNADTCLIDLANGKKLLFDYSDERNINDPEDKRINLPKVLRDDLKAVKRDYYDLLAITHLDDDHTCKAGEFFYLDHAEKYQKGDRIKIRELWVPANVITAPEQLKHRHIHVVAKMPPQIAPAVRDLFSHGLHVIAVLELKGFLRFYDGTRRSEIHQNPGKAAMAVNTSAKASPKYLSN